MDTSIESQMRQMYTSLQQQLTQQVAVSVQSQVNAATASSTAAATPRVHLPKIRQPSSFTGTIGLAVDHWLSEMDQQFTYYSQGGTLTTDNQRIQFAAAYLDGIARQWWETQADRVTLNNWTDFVDRLHARFRPIQASMIARQRLDKLRMREGHNVNAYIGAFHAVTMPIQDMSEKDRIHAFARGLTQRLAAKVWERNPSTLQEAIDYAVTAEATGVYAFRSTGHYGTNTGTTSVRGSSSASSSSMGSAPMDLTHIAMMEDYLIEEPTSNVGLDVPSSTAATPRVDVEALINSAVEQRVNAIMSNSSFKPNGSRPPTGSKNHVAGLKGEEISKLMKENRCFRCRQVGHYKNDPKCPKNAKSKNE
jgi:hypothetical protein